MTLDSGQYRNKPYRCTHCGVYTDNFFLNKINAPHHRKCGFKLKVNTRKDYVPKGRQKNEL